MANAVRKICTKIGPGHQYRLGTTKTPSAYGSHLASDTVRPSRPQQLPAALKYGNECKFHYVDGKLCESQPPCVISQSVVQKRSVAVTVEWFNKHGKRPYVKRSVLSPTHLNSAGIKPDYSDCQSTSNNNGSTSNPKGLPSTEQLDSMYNKLGEELPLMFRQSMNFGMFHNTLIFENNIRGTKTVGLNYFITTISLLRLIGHVKYAFVKFEILKMTKHPEDGTIKLRWRIVGISGLRVFMRFWKFTPWNIDHVVKEHIESWHDGFSIFYLGPDGLIHKLTADKMQPDNDPVVEDKTPLTTKLALFLGLSPQINNLDCLVTFESEPTNELFKMVIMSLEEIV